MAQFGFGDGREMRIEIGQPNGLLKGAGIHRLQFPVTLDARNTMKTGVPFTLSGPGLAGDARRRLARSVVHAHRPESGARGAEFRRFDATIILPLPDDQLAVIEQRRASNEFMTFWFDVQVVLGYDPEVAGDPAERHWPAQVIHESVNVYADTWVRLLRQASTGTSPLLSLSRSTGRQLMRWARYCGKHSARSVTASGGTQWNDRR